MLFGKPPLGAMERTTELDGEELAPCDEHMRYFGILTKKDLQDAIVAIGRVGTLDGIPVTFIFCC